jgi:hypothetical protein
MACDEGALNPVYGRRNAMQHLHEKFRSKVTSS